MVSHRSPVSRSHAAMLLQSASTSALDAYKRGDISESEAIARFDQAAASYVSSARDAFFLRLRTTESLRTPRGDQLPVEGGR